MTLNRFRKRKLWPAFVQDERRPLACSTCMHCLISVFNSLPSIDAPGCSWMLVLSVALKCPKVIPLFFPTDSMSPQWSGLVWHTTHETRQLWGTLEKPQPVAKVAKRIFMVMERARRQHWNQDVVFLICACCSPYFTGLATWGLHRHFEIQNFVEKKKRFQ